MARATHLTIGTADRIRLDARQHGPGREDEENGNEMRQEVQVSVTYALEAGDTNLVRLAEAKALEVQLAHEAVWNRIGAFSSGGNASSNSGCCSGRSKASESQSKASESREDDEDTEDGRDDDPLAGLPHCGDDPFGGGLTPAGAARPFPAAPTNWETQNGGPPQGGRYFPDARSRTGSQALAPGPDREPDPAPDADPVTGPQKILIRSRAKKTGLTPYALESLMYQQFRVRKVEKLTKEQAASLLDALERDLKAMGLKGNERTENEKEGAVHGSDRDHGVTVGTA